MTDLYRLTNNQILTTNDEKSLFPLAVRKGFFCEILCKSSLAHRRQVMTMTTKITRRMYEREMSICAVSKGRFVVDDSTLGKA